MRALIISLSCLLGPAATGFCGTGMVPLPGPQDSLAGPAVAVVESTLELLRHSRDLTPFKNRFWSSSAQHPCDFCPGMPPMPVETYVFQVLENFPDTFVFSYRIHAARVEVERDDSGRATRILVPFTKWLAPSPALAKIGRGKTVVTHLLAKVGLDGDGLPFMETIVKEKLPGRPLTMVEGHVAMAIGTPSFSDGTNLSPTLSGLDRGFGVMHYFSPFANLRRNNIWFKAGIRLEWTNLRLRQDEASYVLQDVALTPVESGSTTLDQEIDLAWQVHDLDERTKTMGFAVPIGISKRWKLGASCQFALGLELAYHQQWQRRTTSSYGLDQHGTDHRIGGVVMTQSNGQPVTYTEPPVVSITDPQGKRLDFFTGRQFSLDGLDRSTTGSFSLALEPSVFLHNRQERMFRIGLKMIMATKGKSREAEPTDAYYLIGEGEGRPTLENMDRTTIRPWVGLVLGVEL